jgi:DNA (cytosine-5)-methyltransferase 1
VGVNGLSSYLDILDQAWQQHLAPREIDAPTVVSTFAGCGGSSLGYSMAGYRELLAVEWDDNAVQTFKLNFPDVPVYHGDITKLSVEHVLEMTGLQGGELDVLDGSPPCFPAGYTVLTTCGKIPIEFCTASMNVLTHTGQFKKVNHAMTRKYSGQLYTIETKYGRKPISCTPEHPFWARRRIEKLRDNRTRKNSTRYKAYDEPQWIAAKDLAVGDVLCEPHVSGRPDLLIPQVITKQRINVEGISGTDASELRLLERECSIDWRSDDMAWVLGFYVAEGHTRGSNPSLEYDRPGRREVIFSVADKEAVDFAVRLDNVGLHAIVQKHSQGSSRVTVSSMDFWVLCQTVGKYADGKFIPPAFLCMPVTWQSQFLDGYFTGDGCIVSSKRINSQKRKATTISWDVATGIARMIARVYGVVASIEVLYPAGYSKIQGRDVEVKEAYSIGYTLITSDRVRPGFVDEYGAWIPIKNISTTDADNIDVYNLEVDEDSSYTVEGLAAHNCQGFSTAGKRDMSDPRNQLFREYVRLLRGLQPKVFVMENVSGMVKGKMKLIFVDILKELKACGYRVSARLMNAMYFNVPQSRARMIFIGVREDLSREPSHPRAQNKAVTAKEAIHRLTVPTIDLQEAAIRPTWQMHRVLKGIEQKKHFGLVRLVWNEPAPTITKDAGNTTTGMVHPLEIRKLTISEIKRLASYPDAFQVVGSFKEKWARIGNSVPPLFMRSIANHIRTNILRPS